MLDRLTIERIDAIAGEGPILVALSGGGDSVALLHLLADQLGAARLRAVVVDHALRDGSHLDAARAQSIAEALGVHAEIATLSWPMGVKAGQASAREQRYRAVGNVARRLRSSVLVTGHTRDDQAETVLIRAARGSSWRGLAGMRAFTPLPLWPEGRGVWLARPLLCARREALREVLRLRGADWIEDPANANPDFARARARKALATALFDPMRLAALAERLAPRAQALDDAVFDLIQRRVSYDGDAMIVDSEAWDASPAIRARALSVLLAAAGAQQRVAEVALKQDVTHPFTRAGALVRPAPGGFRITRDPGALAGRADGAKPPPALPLPVGEETVWDARLALAMREPGWAVIVEGGGPVLARGAERQSVAASDAYWLLQSRVEHLLGRINDTKTH